VKTCLLGALLPLAGAISTPAKAVEGAASLYVPGTGGPATAVMPPLEGVYFDDTIYIYNGSASASKEFVVGGNVVAGLDATIVADFLTTLVVPSTNILGGTLSMGVTVPVGAPMIDANAVVTGPFGNLRSLNVHDSALVVGDPVFNTMLGWKAGKLHIQASSMVNIPVGHYREDQLANLALHRWAVDTSLALSLHDDESGWDLTCKAGVTFNGKNDYTKYDSGNEFHLEGSVEKALSKKFSIGAQGYCPARCLPGRGGRRRRHGRAQCHHGPLARDLPPARLQGTRRHQPAEGRGLLPQPQPAALHEDAQAIAWASPL
jgi:hypothetical protein